MFAVNLQTEYLTNPIGIDIKTPRFFWNCNGDKTQSAYQIICKNNQGKVVWNTGKVKSSSMHTKYAGNKLNDRDRIKWAVTLWNENEEKGAPQEGFFELGISDWKAKWITGNYVVNKRKRYPVDCFKKSFKINKQVIKARLYITACGLYEARINGRKVGAFCLAPGFTDYRQRIQYQTYDVTSLLESNENEITVQLADGWFRGSVGVRGERNLFGTETKFIAQLEITYKDGTYIQILSDDNWQWSNDGSIRFADNKDGEIVDARFIPSYSGKSKMAKCRAILCTSNNVPVTEHEQLLPIVSNVSNGKTLLDFGQNIAGYIHFKINAHAGQEMVWHFGEMVDDNGNLTLDNIQIKTNNGVTPLQQLKYTCKEGLNEYKTTFAVFGFRYAEVNTDIKLNADDIEAIAVYSDMAKTSDFSCSKKLLNKFYKATVWSMKSNSLDLPTDCPTRERQGWTGDAQIFYNTASYLFNYAAFGRKYIRDIFDWQRRDGCLPIIVPDSRSYNPFYTLEGSVGWADAGILLVYRSWKRYGDEDILRDYYGGMKKYAEFMMRRCGGFTLLRKPIHIKKYNKYLVNRGRSYGEWLEPKEIQEFHYKDYIFPNPEVSTAYTSYVLKCMAEIAHVLGKKSDEERYKKYSEGCKKAYQELVKKPEYTLDTDRQARLVRPLFFKLLDKKQTEFARKRLIKALDDFEWRVGTGFLSTPLILDVLTNINIDYAYKLLENDKMPGWLYMVKNGSTTIWESWEGPNAQHGVSSLNHYSKGAVCEWLFKTMCGIRINKENHFIISPKPGGDIKYAKARYNSIYGTIESGWEMREDNSIYFSISIPSNTSATFYYLNSIKIDLEPGNHNFQFSMEDTIQ